MARKNKDSDIVRKTISFDRNDPDQKAELEHAEQRSNFSAYVRTLIRMDRIRLFERETGFTYPEVLKPAPQDDEIDQESAEGFT